LAPKRLTRREIVQEDRIQMTLSWVFEWSSRNRYLLLGGAGLLLLAMLGSYLWQNYQQQNSLQLQVRFAEALEIYHAPVGQETDSPAATAPNSGHYSFQTDQERRQQALESFNAIAEDYSSTNLGFLARYYVALVKHEMEETEEAKQILNSLIQESTQPDVRNLARNFLANVAQQESDREQASSLLQAILEDTSLSFPKETVILNLAQNSEAGGNTDEALKFYKRLLAEYPDSPYTQEVQTRISRLEMEE
jgi:tetratricopeptide (TPR) repeat protein